MAVKTRFQALKSESSRLRQAAHRQVMTSVIAAFGLIVGLAWNDAVKAFIEHLLPINGQSIVAKFFYAGLITIIFIILTTYIIKSPKLDQSESQE